MKTLNECKDEIARKHEFTSWQTLSDMLRRNGVYEQNIGVFHNAVAELYATSQIEDLTKENARLTEVEDCNKRTILNQRQEIGNLKSERDRYREALEANHEYVKFLSGYCSGIASYLAVHRMSPSIEEVERGEYLRTQIAIKESTLHPLVKEGEK
jgi:L-rhamnose mutarotase